MAFSCLRPRPDGDSPVIRERAMRKILLSAFMCCVFVLTAAGAFAWHDETHLAIGKAAGYLKWYNAAGADIAKEKAGLKEARNHYSNISYPGTITRETVLDQAKRYNDPNDAIGHLYGAIIGSLREYALSKGSGKYAQYHIAYCAHYIGDLSQPQHNAPLDDFNRAHHALNEAVVDSKVLRRTDKIGRYMYPITLREDRFEEDLAEEIARIANIARELDAKLHRENRTMTPEEVYRQLGHSASLLEAVLDYLKL